MSTLTDRILVIVDAATGGATQELRKLEGSAKDTHSAVDRMGQAFGVSGQTLKAGLVAGATALIGTGLVSYLNDSAEAYATNAKAAGELATATDGTVDEVSRMQAALEDSGITAEKSAALLTKFAVQAGRSGDAVSELGVELVRNKDGSIDYAASMVAVVDAIGQMGDASRRNQLLVQFFGKQGAASFQELYASGIKLSDAMAAVSKYRVFSSDDVRRAVAYDDAMDSLGASAQGLQFTLGRALIPALSTTAETFTAVLDVINPVIEVLAGIPPEVYLVAGAAVFLSRVIKTELVTGALASLNKALLGSFLLLTDLRSAAGLTIGAMKAVSAALITNPAVLLAAATYVLVGSNQALKSSVEDVVAEEQKQAETQKRLIKSSEDLARQMYDTAGFMAKSGAQLRGLQWSDLWDFGPGSDARKAEEAGLRGFEEQIEETRKALGEYAIVAGAAQDASDDLNKTVAEFLSSTTTYATSWRDVESAARAANETVLAQKQAANLAERAMGLYAVSIQQVISWQKVLAGQPVAAEEALNQIQSSFSTLEDVLDSEGKKIGEHWVRITDNAMTAGDETVIAAGKAQQAIYDYADALAAQGFSSDKIVSELQRAKDKMPELSAQFDKTIAEIQGRPNEMGITIIPEINFADPKVKAVTGNYDLRDPTQFKKWLDATAAVSAGTVVNTEQNVIVSASVNQESITSAQVTIQKLTVDQTVDIYFQTHGYNEVKRIIDNLTRDRTVHVQLDAATSGGGGGGAGPAAMSATPQMVSQRSETTFDLRGARFEGVSDPAAFHREMQSMAGQRRMAGAR